MTNKKPKGKRANTRYLFKGKKLTIEAQLRTYNIGEKVVITPNGRYHSGLPFRRFAGKVGEIVEKRGRSYVVYLDKEKKQVIVGPAHLKPILNQPIKK